MTVPVRSWLYVPGDQPARIGKALAGAADAIVVDLEDAVAPSAKDTARRTALDTLDQGHRVYIRINDPSTPHGERDVTELAAAPGELAGVRVPKSEDPDALARVADALGVPVYPLLESALGVENAYRLATAHPLVSGLALGEADLTADLRASDDEALGWPRSRVVVAARAAGLPSPPQSVYTAVRDLDGLRTTTERGKRCGFFGRSVIHPSQVAVVHQVHTPSDEETRWARELVNRLAAANNRGEGAWVDADGRFVDKAVVERARWLLAATDGR